jgi:hypothetical protein
VTVANVSVKKEIQQRSERWIAHILVVPGHRAGLDFSAKTVAHNHVVALPPHFDEARHVAEVITVVRIAHDDKGAA